MRSDLTLWLANQYYTKLVGRVVPASWYAKKPPATRELSLPKHTPHLEIVSHCWQYAHLAVYQFSSLVRHPPTELTVTHTLFHADSDQQTTKLAADFAAIDTPNVTWRSIALPKADLFRRAIGRNQAAKSTSADWVWFADCDLIFDRNCLDSLAVHLKSKQAGLLFPSQERITELLPPDHPWVTQSLEQPLPVDVDTNQFHHNDITKAKGAFQIVHGDVARTMGYCDGLALYQQPDTRWRKTYEDTVFRNLLGHEGVPVPIDNLLRIRHSAKGRYKNNSAISDVRTELRKRQKSS